MPSTGELIQAGCGSASPPVCIGQLVRVAGLARRWSSHARLGSHLLQKRLLARCHEGGLQQLEHPTELLRRSPGPAGALLRALHVEQQEQHEQCGRIAGQEGCPLGQGPVGCTCSSWVEGKQWGTVVSACSPGQDMIICPQQLCPATTQEWSKQQGQRQGLTTAEQQLQPGSQHSRHHATDRQQHNVAIAGARLRRAILRHRGGKKHALRRLDGRV